MRINYMFFILLIAYSCNQNTEQTIKIIKVDADRSDSVRLSNIASKVDIVLLETTETSLVNRIQDIKKSDEYIFVNDAGSRVLQFNSAGRFVKQIGSSGRGPGEYNGINCFTIDSRNNLVYVASFRQILVFDFSGKLINEIKQETMPEFLTVIGDEFWVVTTSMANKLENGTYLNITKLIKYNTQGNINDSIIIKKVILKSPQGTINPQSFFTSNLGRKQYVYYPVLLPEPVTRDTVYEMTGNILVPSIKLDFGGAAKPVNGRKQIFFANIFLSENYLFAEYNYNKNHTVLCYDFMANVKYYAKQGFIDDFFRSGVVQLKPLNLENGIMYFVKDAYEIVGKIDGVSENSNPVVFIVKLKS
jgi:hypothetical protein